MDHGLWSVAHRHSQMKDAMSRIEVIDTFPAFLNYWADAQGKPLEDQIELWASVYMAGWPELLAMQIQDYVGQDLDWKQVAKERVFPYLQERLPAMQEARSNLLRLGADLYSKAEQILNFNANTHFVIYVGIGCGAGWVAPYQDKYSILFGLENIAECGWSDEESITGLIAHEIGHLAHFVLRTQNNKKLESGAWWQLYTEGFAQYCETLLNNTFHQENRRDDWLAWCRLNERQLASRFIQAADEGQAVNPFFGSWLEIDGHSETGYFLGHEVIQDLAKEMSIQDIALLDDYEKYLRKTLEETSLKR